MNGIVLAAKQQHLWDFMGRYYLNLTQDEVALLYSIIVTTCSVVYFGSRQKQTSSHINM